MKSVLQLRPSQGLSLTPQLQQAIKLLQLSTVELQHEVQTALDENLMLEVDEPVAQSASPVADTPIAQVPGSEQETTVSPALADMLPTESRWEITGAQTNPAQSGSADYDPLAQQSTCLSLQAHLRWQMEMAPFSDQDQQIADIIIDGIDDAGYLQVDIADIVSTLQTEAIDQQMVEAVLHRIQHFDPPGVAARDAQETLVLQAKQVLPANAQTDQVIRVLTDHFDLLAARDEKKLAQRLQVTPAELQAILHDIRGLHPHPGAQIGDLAPNCVVPDVLVSQQAGGWLVELNPNTVPKLRINNEYAALVQRANDSDDNQLLKDHLQTARSFISNIQTRHDTVLQVARCIVAAQHAFLEQGVEAMKPLVLQTVADTLGLHESTVSRVTARKTMQTPRGTFSFKYFFSSHVRTTEGGTASATAVCALIKKLIQAESPQKPLSDNALATLLSEQGVTIARRTVAKYRESLRIPTSSERRRWAG